MMAFKILNEIQLLGGDIVVQNGKLIIYAPDIYLNDEVLINLKHEKEILLNILKLKALINQVSINFWGDDPIFLEEYIEDVIQKWLHDLDKALLCFNDLVK